MTFSLDNLQFLDSYQFMNQSLASMTENLKNADYDFPITSYNEMVALSACLFSTPHECNRTCN